MTPEEVFDLLTQKIQPRDGRTVGKVDVAVWFEDIGDLDFADSCEAVARHFRRTPDTWLKAGHIRAIVKQIRTERLEGFVYVPDDEAERTMGYLAARRAQIEAVASGQRPADPAAIEASPEQAAAVRELCAPTFRRPT